MLQCSIIVSDVKQGRERANKEIGHGESEDGS
jgi:hypothetical protein